MNINSGLGLSVGAGNKKISQTFYALQMASFPAGSYLTMNTLSESASKCMYATTNIPGKPGKNNPSNSQQFMPNLAG